MHIYIYIHKLLYYQFICSLLSFTHNITYIGNLLSLLYMSIKKQLWVTENINITQIL